MQLTQDDGSGSEDGSGGEGNKEFKRASAEELSKRKIGECLSYSRYQIEVLRYTRDQIGLW